MSKRVTAESTLVAAASAFDEQLVTYGRLAELLLKTPLATVKQLERANQTLEEIGATEEMLGTTGRELAQVIASMRDRQQALAEQMVAHLPAVQARNQALRAVVGELQELGEIARAINVAAAGGAAVLEVEQRVGALAAQAEALAARARDADFDEPATQAHALHQQMVAIGRKLHSVTSTRS